MAGLCFFYEEPDRDLWSGRRLHLDAWNYAAKVAGDITKMIVVNRTAQEILTPDAELELFQVVSELPALDNAIRCVGPGEIGEGSILLWDFDHNVDWYVFGPASGWGTPMVGLHVPQANIGACHSIHVATAIMFHRYHVKGGQ
jgi:hypothetical protein